MLRYFLHRIMFAMERLIVRGAFHQMLFIAALIVLVSVVAGAIVWLFVPGFSIFPESVWWGFLRLSDPGYLGDDSGALARTVSAVVTVLGYVLFMGALVAIMNQGLGRMMRRLESGVSPISVRGHILIIGWTNRTATIVKELLLAEGRVRRFLDRHSTQRLRIVVMADEVTADLAAELVANVGAAWDANKVILRSGDPLRDDHLARVNYLEAAAIILPAGDPGSRDANSIDARLIKTLLSMSNTSELHGGRPLPLLTAEFVDADKADIARAAYPGDIEVVPGAVVISRLIAQNMRHSGLSSVYSELLSHNTGNALYTRDVGSAAGRLFGELEAKYSRAIALGVIRPDGNRLVPLLNPAPELALGADDRLVFLAGDHIDIVEDGGLPVDPAVKASPDLPQEEPGRQQSRRILVLGWNQKLPALLGELETYVAESFSLDVVSLVPAAYRERVTQRFADSSNGSSVRHVEADFTAPRDLERMSPWEYDNVVFLASERAGSEEESDARTLLGNLLLRSMLPIDAAKPEILIELIDSDNDSLFASRTGETLVSPIVVSHILAHITVRRDLGVVFEELFTAGGAEIYFREPAYYGLEGSQPVRFREIQSLVAARGDIALGVSPRAPALRGRRPIALNPRQDASWRFGVGDEIVVLTTYRRT